MNKINFILIITAIVVAGCGFIKPFPAPSIDLDFSEAIGYKWQLYRVIMPKGGGGIYNLIDIDSSSLSRDDEIFTLSFDAETVSGVGSPNRYSAPYTRYGETLTIGLVRSTLMASSRDPEKLSEHDFYTYIQNIYGWELRSYSERIYGINYFVLYSKTDDGKEVHLIFRMVQELNTNE